MRSEIFIGILIPFLGTALGAAMVFFLKDDISERLKKILTGFAAGVMVAASFWSLLQPSIEASAEYGKFAYMPAAIGFLIGIGFVLFLDIVTPHMHMDNVSEGPTSSKLKRTTKLILAVTLHNIPEGAIVSMPLKAEGMNKGKTFLYGAFSGIVEPIASIITIFAAAIVVQVLPYMLAFAAGAMMYVVVEELIPEMSVGKHTNTGTVAFAMGFVLMMILDVALG